MIDTSLNIDNSGVWFLSKKETFGNHRYVFKKFTIVNLLLVAILIVVLYFGREDVTLAIFGVLMLCTLISAVSLYVNYPEFEDKINIRNELRLLAMVGFLRMLIGLIFIIILFFTKPNNNSSAYISAVILDECLNATCVVMVQYVVINYAITQFVTPKYTLIKLGNYLWIGLIFPVDRRFLLRSTASMRSTATTTGGGAGIVIGFSEK